MDGILRYSQLKTKTLSHILLRLVEKQSVLRSNYIQSQDKAVQVSRLGVLERVALSQAPPSISTISVPWYNIEKLGGACGQGYWKGISLYALFTHFLCKFQFQLSFGLTTSLLNLYQKSSYYLHCTNGYEKRSSLPSPSLLNIMILC